MVQLTDSLQKVKGIGAKKSQLLSRLGLHTLGDALLYFPYRYDDWRTLLPTTQWVDGDNVVFVGRVAQVDVTNTSRRQVKVVKALLQGQQGMAVATWFNRYQMEKYLYKNRLIFVYGRVSTQFGFEIQVQEHQYIKNEQALSALLRLHPVYSLTEGVHKVDLWHVTEAALKAVGECKELLSAEDARQYDILPYQEAVVRMHRPKTLEDVEKARRSLVIYEFLSLILWGRLQQHRQVEGQAHTQSPHLADAFIRGLPYELTGAQKRAIAEIKSDMASPYQMHRLLQGDVGSGKTNVAFYGMLIAVSNGYQAALMAPTEVLARQHYENACKAFEHLGVKIQLLVGQMRKKEKQEALENIASGAVDCVIGTHALLEDDVIFKALSVVIIDEQHRFGVAQRERLEKKGKAPDLLVTTATPIPRSLALTVYGNLALTVIDEMPKNRQAVQTIWINSARLTDMYGFLKKEIDEQRQVFIVCPLVEESQKIDLENAIALAESLQQGRFSNYRVGLLHGRMSAEDKQDIMEAFRKKEIQLLVSTTVIEVGVDVPNATVMVIMNAERFGLAQLHQLRGRVGRGSEKSYCILVSDTHSEEGQGRMRLMATSHSGFEIAEEDLKQRGPGELLGLRQHGDGLFILARPGYHQEELAIAGRLADRCANKPLTEGLKQSIASIDKKMVP